MGTITDKDGYTRYTVVVNGQPIAYSVPKLPPIPVQSCHPFQTNVATDSGEYCHLLAMKF